MSDPDINIFWVTVFPERVSKVIAVEGLGPPVVAHSPDGMAPSARMRHWIDSRRRGERRRLRRHSSLEEATRRIIEVNPRVRPDIAHQLAFHGVRRNEDGTYSWKFDNYLVAGGLHPDGGEDLSANIRAPVLLVSGGEGWSAHPEWQARARAIPSYRSAVIEGAGHWVHHEQLGRFLEIVEPFLAEG